MRKPRKRWYNEISDKFEWLTTKCKLKHSFNLQAYSDVQKDAFRYACSFHPSAVPSTTQLMAALKIIDRNVGNLHELIDEYQIATSVYDKIRIVQGENAANAYKANIANAVANAVTNASGLDYWLKKGYTEKEAAEKALEHRMNKTSAMRNTKKQQNTKEHNVYMVSWWQAKGYSSIEAKEKVEAMLLRTSTSLEGFISRHGQTEGVEKYNNSKNKRKSTNLSRYGTNCVLRGKTSKESLYFFLPVYKKIRRMGIQKHDVQWGITGSREFASHCNGRNFFYDFTIKSLKLSIEYNGSTWHPRDDTCTSPFYNTQEKLLYDAEKIQHLTNRGFNVITVWDTDNLFEKQNEIIKAIQNALEQ